MNARLRFCFMILFSLGLLGIIQPSNARAETPIYNTNTNILDIKDTQTEGYDLSKIKETSENVDFESLGALAKGYSIPILVVLVVLSGFSALLGLFYQPMKLAAGSLLGIGLVFYIAVNFAPQIVGIMMAIVNAVMLSVSGD